MARSLRIVALLAALAIAAAPAGADIVDKKQSVDSRIASLRDNVQAAKAREEALQREIDEVSGQIQGLERQAGDVSARLAPLERELELRELKLNRLNALFQAQSDRLAFLRVEYRTAMGRLAARLVAVYQTDPPDELCVSAHGSKLLRLRRRARLRAYDRRARQGDRRRGPGREDGSRRCLGGYDQGAGERAGPGQDRRAACPPGARAPRRAAGEQGQAGRGAQPQEAEPRFADREGARGRDGDRRAPAGERRARGEDPAGFSRPRPFSGRPRRPV